MKVYTKTGDKGLTGLIGGTRVSKNDIRLEAYGTVDELNSFIGLLCTYNMPDDDVDFLRLVQHNLFVVGSHLATDTSKIELNSASVLSGDSISEIEIQIDRLDEQLSALTAFVLPGGSQSSALCHVCRTITRRAERRIYEMNSIFSIDEQILVYFNRLSDYFFVLSRYLNKIAEFKEILWKRHD
jgi:cob(I)alamin adenosyltransferase